MSHGKMYVMAVMCLGVLLPALAIEHGAPALRPDTGSEASTWTSQQAAEQTQARMYSKRQVPIDYPADQGSSLASTDSGSGTGGWEASSWSSVDVALETRSRMYYLHGQQAVGPVEVSDQGSAVASTDDGAPAPGTLYYHGYNKPQEGSAVASAGGQGISLENSAVASTDDAAPAPGTLYYHGYNKPQEGSAVASAEEDAAPAPGTLYYHGYNQPSWYTGGRRLLEVVTKEAERVLDFLNLPWVQA